MNDSLPALNEPVQLSWNHIDLFLDYIFAPVWTWEVTSVLSWSVWIPWAAGHIHDHVRTTHTHTGTQPHLRQKTNLHSIFSHLSAKQPRLLRLCLILPPSLSLCICLKNMILADKPKIDYSFTASVVFYNSDSGCFTEWTACKKDVTQHEDTEWIMYCRCMCEVRDLV